MFFVFPSTIAAAPITGPGPWSETFNVSVSGTNLQTFTLPVLFPGDTTYSFSPAPQHSLMVPEFNRLFVNQAEYTSVSVGASIPLVLTCPFGSRLWGVASCVSNAYRGGYVTGTYVVTIGGTTYNAVLNCPPPSVLWNGSCRQGRGGIVRGNYTVTVSDTTYPAVPTCPIGYTLWNGTCGRGRIPAVVTNVIQMPPYTGTLIVSGTGNVFIRTVIGPVTSNGPRPPITGTFLCPSGTFVYGFGAATGQNARNDYSHLVMREVYCAESFGMTTDVMGTRISLYPTGGGICRPDEYVKGFSSFGVSSDNWDHSQLGTMYCAKLATSSPQVTADSFNLLAYNNGNYYAFSAGLGSVKMMAGLTGSAYDGPGGATGARFYPGTLYSRHMPTLLSAKAFLSADPLVIDQGESSKLTWSSTNATSCTSSGGFSTGNATSNSIGVLVTPSATSLYSITCTGPTGTSSPAIATVTVRAPNVSINATPSRVVKDGATNISWNATNVKDCTITKNGAPSFGSPIIADVSRVVASSTLDTITGQTTYVITCSNNSGSGTASATQVVNLAPSFQEF